MREAFRVCDLEMAPYVETAREFCDVDGGTMTGGGGGTNASASSDGFFTTSISFNSAVLASY